MADIRKLSPTETGFYTCNGVVRIHNNSNFGHKPETPMITKVISTFVFLLLFIVVSGFVWMITNPETVKALLIG